MAVQWKLFVLFYNIQKLAWRLQKWKAIFTGNLWTCSTGDVIRARALRRRQRIQQQNPVLDIEQWNKCEDELGSRLLAKGVFADDCRSLRSNWCDRESGQLRDPPRLRRDRGLPNSSTRISAIAVRRQSYETRWERESDTLIEKKKHEHVQKVIKLEPKAAAVPNTATHAYRDRVPCQSSPGSVGRDTSMRFRNSANLVPAFLPICSVSLNTIQAIDSWRGHKRSWNRQRFSRLLVDQYGKRE